jgi:hypothetical protein
MDGPFARRHDEAFLVIDARDDLEVRFEKRGGRFRQQTPSADWAPDTTDH